MSEDRNEGGGEYELQSRTWLSLRDRDRHRRYTAKEIIGTLRIRIRALEAENARLGLVNGDAWRQRAEKAEADLADVQGILKRATWECPVCGSVQDIEFERAAGRESGDRNEGECYGPFHGGLICKDCANRTRVLQKDEAELAAALGLLRKSQYGVNELFIAEVEVFLMRAAGRESGGRAQAGTPPGEPVNDPGLQGSLRDAAAKSAARHDPQHGHDGECPSCGYRS